ncbi:intermembrane transport protein PqiB [Alteromonas sediminis]|uniref:Intermembrane transport protein PqiB n=1 Tax=Alteromonas sediminis TaxID=2259342 RepID=A0A3N5YAK5_9ALTE|nr:intermembrane transport protein PqiB [Alteromonas sediminis]RPJ68609.1 intermembrane transport protein PqiB [Alteromonas sediminis]
MSSTEQPRNTETAKVSAAAPVSRVWFIPLIAIVIGAWIIFTQWSNQGPLITIELLGAAGIEENKTPIKVRDLAIGQVTKITLKEDLDGVIVTARIDKEAEHLLTENSKFWVVSPRISFSEVSGLSTLLSGSYIAMNANGNGRPQTNFKALPRPPVTPPGTPGLHITLTSDRDFAYKEGDPIVYKGHKVGEFEESFFNQYERAMYYTAFVEAPYHRLITENTRFWDASGVKVRLRASGIEVDTGSVETLLSNGVTFDVPEGSTPGVPITDKAYFEIFESEEMAQSESYRLSAEYVLLIDESVRGLNIGAPVEYRGLRVGEVVSINQLPLEMGSLLEADYKIPVVINVYPGKVRQGDTPAGLARVREQIREWIKQDLRATLRIGNLLTGALYVDLNHDEEAASSEVARILDYEIIPTSSTELTQITQKAEALLDKINALPLEQLSDDMVSAVNQMGVAAESVRQSSTNFDALIADVDMKSINSELVKSLQQVSNMLETLTNTGLIDKEAQQSLDELQETMRQIQPLLQRLNQTPNSLIFGRQHEPIEPKAKTVSQEP